MVEGKKNRDCKDRKTKEMRKKEGEGKEVAKKKRK
jgi:hypothetical protein